ncbi:MAG: hypothetical protein CMM25_05380 [Rhodospirillaceae bacterium]|nr:hypothetical protein [Rhodospirillaceae bacterium]|tara:strand:+ start:168 stop:818 length:651 start_codon:yes stop_codon:yes gene_type:complete
MVTGTQGAIIELGIFGLIDFEILQLVELTNLPIVIFVWMSFTVLTGLWEISFVMNRKQIGSTALSLLANREKVWSKKYDCEMIIPWQLAIVFYSEYAAYADREYMCRFDKWSVIIEGSHALFCGGISFVSIMFNIYGYMYQFYFTLAMAMSFQLMNSILYMGQYIIQINNPHSVNYNRPAFPCGVMLYKRPFMYINVFWTVMPAYTLYFYMSHFYV